MSRPDSNNKTVLAHVEILTNFSSAHIIVGDRNLDKTSAGVCGVVPRKRAGVVARDPKVAGRAFAEGRAEQRVVVSHDRGARVALRCIGRRGHLIDRKRDR